MTNRDNILDELFHSKLDSFEETPPAYVWMKIEERQKAGKRKRRLFIVRVSSIAAAVLLAFLLGWQLQEHRSSTQQLTESSPADTEQNIRKGQSAQTNTAPGNSGNEQYVLPEKGKSSFDDKSSFAAFGNSEAEQTGRAVKPSMSSLPERAPSRESLAILAMNQPKIKTQGLLAELKPMQTDQAKEGDVLSETDRLIIERNRQLYQEQSNAKPKRDWSLGAQVTPTVSVNQTSYGEMYASNMSKPGDKHHLGLGGGMLVEYHAGKRWSIQSGLQYSRFNQTSGSSGNSKNMLANDGLAYTYYNNKLQREPGTGQFQINGSAGIIRLDRLPSSVRMTSSLESLAGNDEVLLSSADFDQRFEYIEIPLLLRYKLIDKTWSMNMLGGFSAGMLVGNEVYMNDGSGRISIGETEDMNRMNYAANVGLGIGYRLSPKLEFHLEPQLRYYLHSLSNNPDVDFKPYSIGIYTGLSYRF